MFWVAVTGLTFSTLGLTLGLASVILSWMGRRRVNWWGVAASAFSAITLPLNLYQTLRLWQ